MKIVGINFVVNEDGVKKTTLHTMSEFDSFYSGGENRGCVGHMVENVYVGDYDCSQLKVGMLIEVYYEKAISTKNGSYQRVKKIDILSTGKQQIQT